MPGAPQAAALGRERFPRQRPRGGARGPSPSAPSILRDGRAAAPERCRDPRAWTPLPNTRHHSVASGSGVLARGRWGSAEPPAGQQLAALLIACAYLEGLAGSNIDRKGHFTRRGVSGLHRKNCPKRNPENRFVTQAIPPILSALLLPLNVYNQ